MFHQIRYLFYFVTLACIRFGHQDQYEPIHWVLLHIETQHLWRLGSTPLVSIFFLQDWDHLNPIDQLVLDVAVWRQTNAASGIDQLGSPNNDIK